MKQIAGCELVEHMPHRLRAQITGSRRTSYDPYSRLADRGPGIIALAMVFIGKRLSLVRAVVFAIRRCTVMFLFHISVANDLLGYRAGEIGQYPVEQCCLGRIPAWAVQVF